MYKRKIALLIGQSQSSKYVYNYLTESFSGDEFLVIQERKISRKKLLKYRIKKFGFLKVLGQIIFILIVPKMLSQRNKERAHSLKQYYQLKDFSIPKERLKEIKSVNDEIVKNKLIEFQPDVVIVNGTRIIRDNILSCVKAPFINTHVGITPNYRGVHGGYWALVNNDVENFGVTVHLVDKGVDTGEVIYQKTITPGKNDNFMTYPLIQLGEALPLLKKAVDNVLVGELKTVSGIGKVSKQYFHPSIWEYLFYKFIKGIS